jgi:hypothetical protein
MKTSLAQLLWSGAPATIGENIAIAWKPTREAARAVSAAVPLLQRAKRVHVMSWGRGDEEEPVVNGLDLDGFLKLRDIEPLWHREGEDEPEFLGELLLSRAFDLNADLLVMGCYSHSRAREWVLGTASATRKAAAISATWPMTGSATKAPTAARCSGSTPRSRAAACSRNCVCEKPISARLTVNMTRCFRSACSSTPGATSSPKS